MAKRERQSVRGEPSRFGQRLGAPQTRLIAIAEAEQRPE